MLINFIDSFRSVVLSTIDKQNNPFASYSPFIKNHNKYYVYISTMARHSENLKLNPKVSLFFIEDEILCENIFGRKRVVLQCDVKKLPRDDIEFEKLISLFEKKHGATVNMLKAMKDFSIFEFTPFSGEAIFGFGQAYDIGGKNCDELLERKNIKGHEK